MTSESGTAPYAASACGVRNSTHEQKARGNSACVFARRIRRGLAEEIQGTSITLLGSHHEPVLSEARIIASKAIVVYGWSITFMSSLSKSPLSFVGIRGFGVEWVHGSDLARQG